MCILAGCDFVASMPGMGVKKAHAGVRRFRTFLNVIKSAKLSNTKAPPDYDVDVQRAYWTFRHQRCAPRCCSHAAIIKQPHLQQDCPHRAPQFRCWPSHGARQVCVGNKTLCRVWCPVKRTLVHLHPIPEGGLARSRLFVPRAVPADTSYDFLGPPKPDAVCAEIAAGRLDPLTHLRFVVHNVGGIVHVTNEGAGAPAPHHATAPPAMLGQRAIGGLPGPAGALLPVKLQRGAPAHRSPISLRTALAGSWPER